MRTWMKPWFRTALETDENEMTVEPTQEQPAQLPVEPRAPAAPEQLEEQPKPIRRLMTKKKVEKLIAEGKYPEVIDALISSKRLMAQFDVEELFMKPEMRYKIWFDIISHMGLDANTIFPPEAKKFIINDIQENLQYLFQSYKEKGNNFLKSEIYQNMKRWSGMIGFDLDAYVYENLGQEIFNRPEYELEKGPEELMKLREHKIRTTDMREFPYKVTDSDVFYWSNEPEWIGKGKYEFSFAIHSVPEAEKAELGKELPFSIFERLNPHVHTEPTERPVGFVFGTYTPGKVLYVAEIQSDVVQKSTYIGQSWKQMKAKLEDDVKINKEIIKNPSTSPEDLAKAKKKLKAAEYGLNPDNSYSYAARSGMFLEDEEVDKAMQKVKQSTRKTIKQIEDKYPDDTEIPFEDNVKLIRALWATNPSDAQAYAEEQVEKIKGRYQKKEMPPEVRTQMQNLFRENKKDEAMNLKRQYEGAEMPGNIKAQLQEYQKLSNRDTMTEATNEHIRQFFPEYAIRGVVERYFSGFGIVAMNTIFNFAKEHNIPTIYVASADLIYRKWVERHAMGDREGAMELYKREYDDLMQGTYNAKKEGTWWKIELENVKEKIAGQRRWVKTALEGDEPQEQAGQPEEQQQESQQPVEEALPLPTEQIPPEPEQEPRRRWTKKQVQTLIDEGKHKEALDILLSSKRIMAQFDAEELMAELSGQQYPAGPEGGEPRGLFRYMFETIAGNGGDIKKVLPPKIKEFIETDIKENIRYLFQNYKETGKNFLKSARYQTIEKFGAAIGFDVKEYVYEEMADEIYGFPAYEHEKKTEDVAKLRQLKVTDTDHREFPYKVVPWTSTPASNHGAQGRHEFSFAVNSTDTIFPEEIFKKLNKHHAPGNKPVAFVFGNYTPGKELYVSEMQSDPVQRAQLYLNSYEDTKKKYEDRVVAYKQKANRIETGMAQEGEALTEEDTRRFNKDKEVLEEINYWKDDFMPQNQQLRSKFQNYFSGWNIIAMNTVLNFAREHNIPTVYVVSADRLEKDWQSYQSGAFTKEMYTRLYDNTLQERYGAKREGDWWKIELAQMGEKIARQRGFYRYGGGGYDKLYKKFPIDFSHSDEVKDRLSRKPEVIAGYIRANIEPQAFAELKIGFWGHIPFYDESQRAIYLPSYFLNMIHDDSSVKEAALELADDLMDALGRRGYTLPEIEELMFELQESGLTEQEIEEYIMDEVYSIDHGGYGKMEQPYIPMPMKEFNPVDYYPELSQYEIRMILHELQHFVDHVSRGEEFVTETTGYFKDDTKEDVDRPLYFNSPAEKKSFMAEMVYLMHGNSDEEVVKKMMDVYEGDKEYWQGLLGKIKEPEGV